jgi:predicted small metal-binding protein
MVKVVYCPCGVTIRDSDDAGLIRQAQKHAKDTHEMDLTDDQVLAMARPEQAGG